MLEMAAIGSDARIEALDKVLDDLLALIGCERGNVLVDGRLELVFIGVMVFLLVDVGLGQSGSVGVQVAVSTIEPKWLRMSLGSLLLLLLNRRQTGRDETRPRFHETEPVQITLGFLIKKLTF